MRIRSNHIVIAFVVSLAGFFLLVYLRSTSATDSGGSNVIEEAQRLREQGRGSSVRDGLLPGEQGSMDSTGTIELPGKVFDAGEIINSDFTVKEIFVANRGKAPLEISEIRTSCGCTVGEMEKNLVMPGGKQVTQIPPGGRMPMKITIDPFRIPGFHSRKTLTVYSNDPKNPQASIDVAVTIVPEYTVEPNAVEFGNLEKGQSAEVTMIVREANAPDLEITGAEAGRAAKPTAADGTPAAAAAPLYTVDVQKRPESDWASPEHAEWAVTLRLSPDLPTGSFKDTFFILANSKRVDRVGFHVSALVDTFFSVAPAMFSVRNAVSPGQEHIATAVVSADEPLTLEELMVTGEALQVTSRPGDKPNTVFI
ncbi:MAG: DUF1573 domain-containing protein, partial [Candidatus Hydrogenedentes bacterium]|nr:DUF1573 domain-containing protein [Candidatus Hydrogenedentota bacterium]